MKDNEFKGHIGKTIYESEASWPIENKAPDAAPNIIIALLDDVGFSQLGCYGSTIKTPNIDTLADNGLRYNNFHTAITLKKKINKIIKNLCKKNKCALKIEYIANGDSFLTKPGKTIYMAKRIIKKVTKNNPKFSTTGGTSDARFIKKIAPCLEFGLVNKTMHKVDECVSISDLRKLTDIYKNILVEYFK